MCIGTCITRCRGDCDHRRHGVASACIGHRDAAHALNRQVRHRPWRPEPWAVIPSPKTICTSHIIRVLVRHPDVRCPKIVIRRIHGNRPCWIRFIDRVRINKCLVLHDQGRAQARQNAPRDQILLHGIGQHVGCFFTGIDVESCQTKRVVVIEHHPSALLVGVKEGHRPGFRGRHIRNIDYGNTYRVGCCVSSRCDPLILRTIADPWRHTTMQVQRRTVFRVSRAGHAHSSC